MSNRLSSRRNFLSASGLTLGSLALGGAARSAPAVQTPAVRRRLDPSQPYHGDLVTQLAQAINRMRNPRRGDPQSWNWFFQANIHGDPNTGFMRCQHSNWWFLPWHRMYLYYFERIVRRIVGDSTFALPYWDWTNSATLTLTAEFRQHSGPLHNTRRCPYFNNGNPLDRNSWNSTLTRNILSIRDFLPTFGGSRVSRPGDRAQSGQFEGGAHNTIHNLMSEGCGRVGFRDMGDNFYAARDPIFWMHHANVDRIWVHWLNQNVQPRRQHPDRRRFPDWYRQQFTFWDENGNPATRRVEEFLTTEALDYVYDDAPPSPPPPALLADVEGAVDEPNGVVQPGPAPDVTVAAGVPEQHALQDEPVTVALSFDPQGAQAFAEAFDGPPEQERSLILVIEGLQFAEGGPGQIDVYLNVPERKEAAMLDPRRDEVHYVGFFSLFGPFDHRHADEEAPPPSTDEGPDPRPDAQKDGHEQKAGPEQAGHDAGSAAIDQTFDVTALVKNQQAAGLWKESPPRVVLVPRAAQVEEGKEQPKATAAIRFRRVSLVVH